MALVESAFKALAPNSSDTIKPRATYITTIDTPYVTASRIAFLRSLLRLRKKLTVIGIIGHTHGVKRARNPPTSPARNMYSSELFTGLSYLASSFITGVHSFCTSALSSWGAAATALSADATESAAASWARASWAALGSSTPSVKAAAASLPLADFASTGLVFASAAAAFASTAGDFPWKLISTRAGGVHISSLQAPYSRWPLIVYVGLVNLIFCTN